MAKAKYYFRIMFAAGILFGLFFAVGAGVGQVLQRLIPAATTGSQAPDFLAQGSRTNILILGVDARSGQTKSRSDTMILVSLDPQLKKVAVVSIPRDSRVKINGNWDKINAANAYGGPQLATEQVAKLLSTRVDYYVELDFNGFKDIINTLGGVEINVPQRMYKPSEDIDLKPGLQRLDGRGALAFVRFREYVYGDIQRTQEQQIFIQALAKEVLQPQTLTRLPQLADQIHQSMDTNLSLADMVKLIAWAPAFKSDAIVAQTLPGKFLNEYASDGTLGESFWQVDEQAAPQVLDNLFADHTQDVVQGANSPPASKTSKQSTPAVTTTGKSLTPSAAGEGTKKEVKTISLKKNHTTKTTNNTKSDAKD